MVLRPEVLRHPGQVMFPDQSDLDLAASVPLPAVASAPPVAAVSVMGSALQVEVSVMGSGLVRHRDRRYKGSSLSRSRLSRLTSR